MLKRETQVMVVAIVCSLKEYLVDSENEEKLALNLLVTLFMAKKETYSDVMKILYEKCLVSTCL